MTRLKCFRFAQPLPGDALGRSADRSSKGTDGREPNAAHPSEVLSRSTAYLLVSRFSLALAMSTSSNQLEEVQLENSSLPLEMIVNTHILVEEGDLL